MKESDMEDIPEVVRSLVGAGAPIDDDDLDGRKAHYFTGSLDPDLQGIIGIASELKDIDTTGDERLSCIMGK